VLGVEAFMISVRLKNPVRGEKPSRNQKRYCVTPVFIAQLGTLFTHPKKEYYDIQCRALVVLMI
jgi:hypothetical protein